MIKINRLSPDSNNFTQILTTIALPPEKLYFIGILPDQRRPAIAIIGARKPTSYGREVTYKIAYELAKRGVVIVSGLALGIDAIAHRAALEAGGTTIAVIANGFPAIQPSSNRELGEQIVARGGAIITEYEPDTPPLQFRFLERNRLVSGLSDGILITEAAARSGTLNTTARALEQNREVFVVPGNITSPMSAGCNMLLRQGATPVTCAEDILEVIAPELLRPQTALALGTTPQEVTLIELLQSGMRDGDGLQQASGLSATDYATTLTMLELAGTVRPLGGNQWTLR
jgi:DNA processing protein